MQVATIKIITEKDLKVLKHLKGHLMSEHLLWISHESKKNHCQIKYNNLAYSQKNVLLLTCDFQVPKVYQRNNGY